jgi:signal transduction histidine kinase
LIGRHQNRIDWCPAHTVDCDFVEPFSLHECDRINTVLVIDKIDENRPIPTNFGAFASAIRRPRKTGKPRVKMRDLLACILGGLLALSLMAAAQAASVPVATAVLGQSTPRVDLAPSIWLLEDPSGNLTIDDIRAPEQQARFRAWPAQQGDVNQGFSASAWWIRVRLQRDPQSRPGWILNVPYAYNKLIDYYAPAMPPVLTGHARPVESRPLFSRHFAFIANVDEQPQDYYFRVASSFGLSFPLTAWQPSAYARHTLHGHVLEALYHGALLTLVMNALFIALVSRDMRFGFYALYGIGLNLVMFAGNGWGRVLLWTSGHEFDEIAGSFFSSLTMAALLLLVRQVLRTDAGPRGLTDRVLFWGAVLAILMGAMMLAIMGDDGWIRGAQQVFIGVALVLSTLITAALWAMRRTRLPGKIFFFASWSMIIVGVVVASVRLFGLLPTNALTSYAVQIATALEMLLLSLSLASLLRHERRERLHSQSQMIDVLKNQEQRLERAVRDRTQALNTAIQSERRTLAEYLRFAALVSHEFRNGLNIISGESDMLRRQAHPDAVMQRTQIIRQQVARLAHLTDTWLKSDQLLNSQIPPRIEAVDCRSWLPATLDQHPQYRETHTVEWQIKTCAETLWADPQLLEIALLNLLSNACKYAPEGSLIQVSTVAKRTESGLAMVGLCVADQGSGISADLHEKIFDRYFRVNPEGGPSGIGLGLSFVRHIAEQHEGDVEVVSAPGQGARFTIWFPDRRKP